MSKPTARSTPGDTSDKPVQSLGQRRAKSALAAIRAYAEHDKVPAKEKEAYSNYAKSIPAMIVMNGLGQTMATQLAQGGKQPDKGQGGKAPNAHRQIYDHLEEWLCGGDGDASPFRKGEPGKSPWLMQCLCDASEESYLIAQAEALAYLEWLKKFANALLTGGDAKSAEVKE